MATTRLIDGVETPYHSLREILDPLTSLPPPEDMIRSLSDPGEAFFLSRTLPRDSVAIIRDDNPLDGIEIRTKFVHQFQSYAPGVSVPEEQPIEGWPSSFRIDSFYSSPDSIAWENENNHIELWASDSFKLVDDGDYFYHWEDRDGNDVSRPFYSRFAPTAAAFVKSYFYYDATLFLETENGVLSFNLPAGGL
ncbi:MAG: hypothetical protein HYS22_04515 [Deltaproteobacteria bacterium]|nr:hypothetical protein [Deltaproteobacteria bacterium]